MKSIESIKQHTIDKPKCYWILKDGRVVYSGNIYRSIRALALYFMGVNISLEQVQELEEITSTDM